ncbi:zf-HC2 domain-containing protein [Actinoplanes sp. NPDC020271]|uniref:zf-HC2 domain-containing protein n=1 Tax=Actinoplanes sp. NPDC020271 TaxID=3363896 RepID=UPI0037B98397
MSWHVDEGLLDAYQQGRLDPSRVMAVDAHLQACPSCRIAVPVDAAWLDRSWTAVLDRIQSPAPGPVERIAERAGLPGHRLRLLAATPALRWSWLAATVAVLTFGVVAAYAGNARTALTWFLIVAPVLPVLAVATAYGPPFDPMHEIAAVTPAAGPALVLWRATAVVGVSMALGTVAAVLLPGPGWYAVAWLLPAFLLSISALALATVMPLPLAAGLLAATWVLATGGLSVSGGALPPPVFGPGAQSGYLLAAAGAAAVLTRRRRRLDPGESR